PLRGDELEPAEAPRVDEVDGVTPSGEADALVSWRRCTRPPQHQLAGHPEVQMNCDAVIERPQQVFTDALDSERAMALQRLHDLRGRGVPQRLAGRGP